MAKTIDEIGNALMGGLYSLVSKAAGDVTSDAGDDPFICWCKPGVPFDPEDFRFAKYMLSGQGASEDEKVADAALQLTQAAGFSRFVDFVPSVNGVHEGRVDGGVLRPGSAALSEVYRRILESSQVAELPDPAGLAEKIAKLREEAKPMQEAYFKHQDAYTTAKAELVSARLRAAYSAKDKLEFQAKGAMLKSKVTQALQAWEVDGFKSQYENNQAEILSLMTRRKPAIWRAEALNNYNSLPEGTDATFGEARFTLPYPGGFAASNSGWTSFAMETKAAEELSTSKTSKWGGSGGIGWGSFKIGASGSGSTTEAQKVSNTENFSLKLSIAQVMLLRNWFDPWFLKSEFWRFNPASVEGANKDVVSDAGSPPKGLLTAYPVSAIFVKDVEIGMDELKDESSELVKTLKGEGKGGWGFGALNIGGSYERNGEVKNHAVNVANGKLTVQGLQLVGLSCEMMTRSPKPKEGVAWVGA